MPRTSTPPRGKVVISGPEKPKCGTDAAVVVPVEAGADAGCIGVTRRGGCTIFTEARR